MAFLKKLDAILLCALLTSCEEVFTPDVVQSPVLCVNALVTAGDTIEVAVSKSRLYTDTASSATVVRDATVNIYANGQLQPAAYVPREDDEIKVEVESPTLGKALAKVTVPGAATIPTVEWEASDVEVRSYLGSTLIPQVEGVCNGDLINLGITSNAHCCLVLN